MSTVAAREGTFGAKLHAELNSRNMGARTLARLLVRQYGGSLEDRRRTIVRWLKGQTPIERNRHIVEDALGMPRDSLKGNDEDEEEDLFPLYLSVDLDLLVRAVESRMQERVTA